MRVWCMNLKDNRGGSKRNHDKALKFQLCLEKGLVAIGWGISDVVNTWNAYKEKADLEYDGSIGYRAARNNLQNMGAGDLVWVKSPVTNEYYLVKITDDTPGICNSLKKFDICAYRRGTYYAVDEHELSGALCRKRIRAVHTLERMHDTSRGDTIRATIELFKKLESAADTNGCQK